MFTAAAQLKCCSKVRGAAAGGGEGGAYHTQMNSWSDTELGSLVIVCPREREKQQ